MRVSPYVRLKERARKWADEAKYPHTKFLWRYAKDDIAADKAWTMRNLQERVIAADQLGYDVILRSTEHGLEVSYRKRPSDPPWEIS